MNTYEIYISSIIWGDIKKRRPVLIIESSANDITCFRITTHHQSNIDGKLIKYFVINDWQQAGLNNQSYIDTSFTVTLPKTAIDEESIGKLSIEDEIRLIDFIKKKGNQQ